MKPIETTDDLLSDEMESRFAKVVELYRQIERDTGEDYSFQLPSIRQLAIAVQMFDGGLDASDTGTGKTAIACAVAILLELPLFVVCPKNVMPPWLRMAELFRVQCTVINYEMLRTGRTEFGRWEWQTARNGKRYRSFQFDLRLQHSLVVFDECHRLKDYRTLTCNVGIAAIESGFRVLALSATAVDNPMHMKFVGLLTGLFDHPSMFYGWMLRHGVYKGRFGLQFCGGQRARAILSELHHKIFPMHGARIRIADLGDLFPQTRIIPEAYAVDDPQKIDAIYREMHEELNKLHERRARDGIAGLNPLTIMLRARQEVELIKVPTLETLARDGLEEGMSVVLFLNFDASIMALHQRMRKLLPGLITGSVPQDQRQPVIDGFNAGRQRLVIANIKAGGLGISLHKPPRILVIVSPTFSGIDLKQALGRCHRAGGGHSIQKIVFAAGTVEEKACRKVRARLQRVSIFNDDQLDDALAI